MNNGLRKFLQTNELLKSVRAVFESIVEPASKKNGCDREILLSDCLMSGLAMFGLKCASLLEFDTMARGNNEIVRHNLKQLYGVEIAPCDTYMRKRLDEVDPAELRKGFTKIFAQVQRGKELEEFEYFSHYILSLDGTEAFSSHEIHCNGCCQKVHKDGKITYYHQILCGAIVNPHNKIVIPLAPEFIMKEDGAKKNDCEYNATLRFIGNYRREHPHLATIVVNDALTTRVPVILAYQASKIHFISGVKVGSHQHLFDFALPVCKVIERTDRNGAQQMYRYINNMPLTGGNAEVSVNFLHYTEIDKKGKKVTFSWVTDFELTEENLDKIMRIGRARWKIENETFNTLKNQGYQFEHNFGHGKKNLNQVFAMLMLLAFLIDQISELCDTLFQAALKNKKRKKYLWKALASFFCCFTLESWSQTWTALAYGIKGRPPIIAAPDS